VPLGNPDQGSQSRKKQNLSFVSHARKGGSVDEEEKDPNAPGRISSELASGDRGKGRSNRRLRWNRKKRASCTKPRENHLGSTLAR